MYVSFVKAFVSYIVITVVFIILQFLKFLLVNVPVNIFSLFYLNVILKTLTNRTFLLLGLCITIWNDA